MYDNYRKMLESPVEALCSHLRHIGLEATVESLEHKRSGFWSLQTIIGSVKVANRNIDSVELVRINSSKDAPGDVSIPVILYRCQYVVKARNEDVEDIELELKPIYKDYSAAK